MNYTLADGKMTDSENAGSVNIAKAGTYTVTVKVGENSDLAYSIVVRQPDYSRARGKQYPLYVQQGWQHPSCRDEQGERWRLYLQVQANFMGELPLHLRR